MPRAIKIELIKGQTQFSARSHLDRDALDYDHPLFSTAERQIRDTEKLGRKPLWHGYQALTNYGRKIGTQASRSVRDVSTTQDVCRFYSYLVTLKKPEIIVEFGSAFGVSGMYWLTGLEANGTGTLYSFEPNTIWFDIARSNFAQISDRVQIFNSTFEEGYPCVPHGIDLAFIDAIHTGDFVRSQLSLILEKASPGCLIVFDDINFSDDMRECWTQIAQDPRYAAVWDIDGRAGMVETRLPQ